jgi:hypothetical protein
MDAMKAVSRGKNAQQAKTTSNIIVLSELRARKNYPGINKGVPYAPAKNETKNWIEKYLSATFCKAELDRADLLRDNCPESKPYLSMGTIIAISTAYACFCTYWIINSIFFK